MPEKEELEIEISKMNGIIHEKIQDFEIEYMRYPRFIKMPLGIVEGIKTIMKEIQPTYEADFKRAVPTYMGLIVCETITIQRIEEIEVF